MEISNRLTRWIRLAFTESTSERVLEELRGLPDEAIGGQDPERIQAALVIGSAGDWTTFQRQLDLVKTDWRDALVVAGLGDANWAERLNQELGASE